MKKLILSTLFLVLGLTSTVFAHTVSRAPWYVAPSSTGFTTAELAGTLKVFQSTSSDSGFEVNGSSINKVAYINISDRIRFGDGTVLTSTSTFNYGSQLYSIGLATGALAVSTGTLEANKVPYTGATGDTNLGAFKITGSSLATPGVNILYNGAIQTSSGNVRGTNAVDLQNSISINTQVASGIGAVIAGGIDNTASGDYSVVSGGRSNSATANSAVVIGGGQNNIASGQLSTVLGGSGNTASGTWSTVLGGYQSQANMPYSLSLGRRAITNGTGSVTFADSTDADFINNSTNTFKLRFNGGYDFTGGTTTVTALQLADGSILTSTGAFAPASGGGYVQKIGDSMSGSLTITGAGISASTGSFNSVNITTATIYKVSVSSNITFADGTMLTSTSTLGGGGTGAGYTTSFTDGNLVGGILGVTHSLNTKYTVIAVYDENDTVVIPDDIVGYDVNKSSVTLSSYAPITGTWNVRVVK